MSDRPTHLRVLHTESSINLGGQELRILGQIRWLLNHGHQSWLLARQDSQIYQEARRLQLPCHPVDLRGSVNPFATLEVARLWRRHNIDVLDCHSNRDASLVMPLHWRGYPVVHTQHICKELKADWSHRLVWGSGARRVLAVSQSIANRLTNQKLVSPNRISVVGEGVDLSVFRPGLDGGAVRQGWGVPAGAKLLTVVGMIRPDKAQYQLVRAAFRIAAAVPEVWCMFVGSPTRPEYGEQLQQEIEQSPLRDRMIRTGFQRQVEQYVAAGDLLVVTSQAEAQSMVVPQAFALKRAVVAPELGGIPELVQDRITGYLYPPGNVDKLAEAVILALQSDNTEMIEGAHEFARQRLSIDRQMERTLAVYRSVIQR